MVTPALIAVSKICELTILLLEDMPPEERRASWRRWFKFWAPIWAALGLDGDAEPITGPAKGKE